MTLDGVNGRQDKKQRAVEDFNAFAARQNATFPEQTKTVEEKERAIAAKKAIMAHPGCPEDTKITLQKEITIIEGEIARIKQKDSMNTSIFGMRSDLG